MAYNLQPLITILQQILDPEQTRWIVEHKKPEVESLLEKATSLQQILEKSSVNEIERVESQIRDAAHKAEDIIESNMVDQIRSKLGLSQISQELDSVMNFIKEKTASSSSCGGVQQATQQVESLQLVEGMKKDLVGVDPDLRQLKEQLTNIIESYIIDRTFSTLGGLAFTFSTEDLQQVMQQLDSAKEQVVKLMEGKTVSKGTSSSSCASFSQEVESLKLVEGKKMEASSKRGLVGVDADLLWFKDRLTNDESKLKIIPIVGMGGIALYALPSLEALKIFGCVFESEKTDEDEEWEMKEGDEFPSLQFLQISGLDLVRWRADETNFPRLEKLLVYRCLNLEEIPSAIGDISTLQLIDVWRCNDSVVASAQKIKRVQQEECENYDLQVQVDTE